MTLDKKDLKISTKEWKYRGEGNANVVISLPKHRQILRIRKTEKHKTVFERIIDFLIQIFNWDQIFSTEQTEITDKKELRLSKLKIVIEQIINWMVQILNSKYKNIIYRELSDLKFYKKIVRPLLGYRYTCDATSVFISKDQIDEIDNELSTIRPSGRKHKRLSYGQATLFKDYTFLPLYIENNLNLVGATYAIEFKPKQGWYCLDERNFTKCQFCLKQYLKLQNKQIRTISSYCPLDLFSGNKKRMTNAIKSLIKNPQNNFKVFKDGSYVYGENCNENIFYDLLSGIFNDYDNSSQILLDEFCTFLFNVLTTKFQNTGCVTDKCKCCSSNVQNVSIIQNSEECSCIYSESKLPYGCILERILSMQKYCQDSLNYYNKIYNNLEEKEKNDWEYVDACVQKIISNKNKCPNCLVLKYSKNFDERNESKANVLSLLPYLLAAIARDCSFMVTFKRIFNKFENKDYIFTTKYASFAVNIGVLDLYPKPLSTIKKSLQRNIKMIEAYRSLSNSNFSKI